MTQILCPPTIRCAVDFEVVNLPNWWKIQELRSKEIYRSVFSELFYEIRIIEQKINNCDLDYLNRGSWKFAVAYLDNIPVSLGVTFIRSPVYAISSPFVMSYTLPHLRQQGLSSRTVMESLRFAGIGFGTIFCASEIIGKIVAKHGYQFVLRDGFC